MKTTSNGSRDPSAVAADAAAATRALYERYSQRVFTFCVSRLRDPEEAQDAMQTTFIYALRALDKGVEPRFELAWLLAIAQNVCRSTRRSLDRHDARTSYVDVTELEAAAESMHAETGEDLAWLRDSLERLPENQRRAILLREWQGLSYADIAAELHLSLAAVEALIFRARRTLASQIDRARRGLKALDPGALGLVLRNACDGVATKAVVAGVGLAAAVGPVAEAEFSHHTVVTARPRVQQAPAPSRPAARPRSTRRGSPRSAGVRASAVANTGRQGTTALTRPVGEAPPSRDASPPPPPAGGAASSSIPRPEVRLVAETIGEITALTPPAPPVEPVLEKAGSTPPGLNTLGQTTP